MVIILCGKSGCGKDTIMKEFVKYKFTPIVSYTTRPKRSNETDGIDYNFVSKEDFMSMIANDDLIEFRSYKTLLDDVEDTWYYGVKKSKLLENKTYVIVLDFCGAEEFQKYYGKDNCFTVYIDVDENTRKERALNRGSFSISEWLRRTVTDNNDFSDDKIDTVCDVTVFNTTTVSDCVSSIMSKYIRFIEKRFGR